MRDSDIRAALHRTLLQPYHLDPNTLVVEELGLRHGSCRADIAIINGQLLGVEIKSDKDSLLRLEKQAPLYDAVFDAVVAVVGGRYEPTIGHCVPPHWGIVVASVENNGVMSFNVQREAKVNRATSSFAVAQLLCRSEALLLLEAVNPYIDARRLRRSAIYESLVQSVSADVLREEVRR